MTETTRIAHVAGGKLSFGLMSRLRTLTHELSSTDYDHSVISLERSTAYRRRFAEAFPNAIYCGQTNSLDPTFVPRLARRLRKLRPHAIHCWGDVASVMFRLANRLAGSRPVISEFSTSLNGVDHVVVSNEEEASLVRQFHVGSITACRAGVSLPPDNEAVWPLAAELDLPSDTKFFAIVGDIVREARIEDAMWGFDLLGVIRQNSHLLVIGSGPHLERLKAFSQQMTWPHLVHFLSDRADLSDVLRQCVATLHANADDGQPVLEAMAAGVPTVAVEGVQTSDRVVAGETGFLIPPRDPGEFARRVNILLADPDSAHRMGAAARVRAATEYPIGPMVEAYRRQYAAMTDKEHRRVA